MIALEHAALIAGLAFAAGLALGVLLRRRLRSPERVEPAPAATPQEVSTPAPCVPAPDPDSLVRARALARAQHEIAQYLGFDAIPAGAAPTIRRVTVDATDIAALDHLARGEVGCVTRVVPTRDGARAALWIDLARAAP